MANTINQRQEKVFEYIKQYIEINSFPPSVRDICKGVNIKSTSTAYGDLKKLENLGYIKTNSAKSRSIEIVKEEEEDQLMEETISIPVLGRVAAGEPILAVENIDYFFPVPSHYSNKGDLFILTIAGESMIDAGILDGDKVLVRKQNTAENGDIVVALIEDSATVKRFFNEDGRIYLKPENSNMDIIVPDNLIILGRVIALFRDQI